VTIKELINELKKYDQDMQVRIYALRSHFSLNLQGVQEKCINKEDSAALETESRDPKNQIIDWDEAENVVEIYGF
jgi:hypothetical protein